ncbi:hypothetical protein CLG85_017525 [Yangia mangrovi]|uniref:Uncharacterized protein n=1 Tax=Alloyangia mangrovi TaxID=1779329 RepID=A0A2A3K2L8_9RHOB|nr:hypothetical protein [Alloyangia mangrovi]MCT4372022.1 hypothetical protein [Alloyangia mangrovi]
MNAIQKRAVVQAFLARHDLDLQHSCLQLGGAPALGRLQRFRRAVAVATRLTTGHRRELGWLQRLLLAEHGKEVGFDEVDFFHDIDPADPSILTICLLTEALAEVISALGNPGGAQGSDEAAAA